MTAMLLAIAWGVVAGALVAQRRPVAVGRALALTSAPARPLGTGFATALPAPRRALTVLALAVVVGVVVPPLGLAVLLGAFVRPLTAQRRLRAARDSAVERDVGDVVALVSLAVNAGCNLPGALEAASAHADGPVAEALRTALATVRRGSRIADALETLPDQLGESVRPFITALIACDRYGAALGPTLDRLAVDTRTAARQRAEAAARRLPVRLLFPLVSCILPAFALLTVAPLIAGSVKGLGL